MKIFNFLRKKKEDPEVKTQDSQLNNQDSESHLLDFKPNFPESYFNDPQPIKSVSSYLENEINTIESDRQNKLAEILETFKSIENDCHGIVVDYLKPTIYYKYYYNPSMEQNNDAFLIHMPLDMDNVGNSIDLFKQAFYGINIHNVKIKSINNDEVELAWRDLRELILLIKNYGYICGESVKRKLIEQYEPEPKIDQIDETLVVSKKSEDWTKTNQECPIVHKPKIEFQKPVPLHHYNECYSFYDKTLKEIEVQIREEIKSIKGRRIPYSRGVMSETIFELHEEWSMDNIIEFCKECESKTGLRPVQISIHSDEPHLMQDKFQTATPHVHIIWIVYSRKGNRIKLDDNQCWTIKFLFNSHAYINYADRININQSTT